MMRLSSKFLLCYVAYTIALTTDLSSALKISELVVPAYKVAGEPVELECHFDLQKESLYTVKWYRDAYEFFRYEPQSKPSIVVFDLPGVSVNTALSDPRKVTLRPVSLESSGRYRCEVSADYPTFHTETKGAEMLIVDLPDERPHISGGRERYHIGDQVHVNCTSARSRPAASLMWYINGEQAKSSYLVDHAPMKDTDNLETSLLGLKFIAEPRHFPDGVLKLRCTATIAAVYWQSSETSMEGRAPQRSPALESKAEVSGCCTINTGLFYWTIFLLPSISLGIASFIK